MARPGDSVDPACRGFSASGRCQAPPLWAVSKVPQPEDDDPRVCGRHLSWWIRSVNDAGVGIVAVARLISEPADG